MLLADLARFSHQCRVCPESLDERLRAMRAARRDLCSPYLRTKTGIRATSAWTSVDNTRRSSRSSIQGGRGAAIYRLADDNAQTNPIDNRPFIDAEYDRAFVATQYFGYLRRDADIAGLLFWLGQVNRFPIRDVGIQHAMVCSFITSAEYQLRFGTQVTQSNAECPQ